MDALKFVNILKIDDKLKDQIRLWRNTDEIKAVSFNSNVVTKKEHLNWLEKLRNNNNCLYWMVYFNDKPIAIGYLRDINHKKLDSEWGFYIGNERFRGRGLGTIIEYNIIEYAFAKMKLKSLFCDILEHNTMVMKMHKAFGFQEEDCKQILKDNTYVDVIKFRINRNKWINSKDRIKKIIQHLNIESTVED